MSLRSLHSFDSEGGWHDRSEMSDGLLYTRFCQRYGYRHVGPVLGEHY